MQQVYGLLNMWYYFRGHYYCSYQHTLSVLYVETSNEEKTILLIQH